MIGPFTTGIRAASVRVPRQGRHLVCACRQNDLVYSFTRPLHQQEEAFIRNSDFYLPVDAKCPGHPRNTVCEAKNSKENATRE